MHTRIASLAVALALAACSSTQSTGPLEPPKGAAPVPGVEAVLLPKNGSAAQGDVKIMQRGDVLWVLVSLNNLPPGPFRVVIHERDNCSSPNAFSAGRPWAPPGDPRAPTELLPVVAMGANGHGQMTLRLRGVKLTGPDSLAGRSVLIHAGDRAAPALVPDVPNDVVLCGTLGGIRSFMEAFQ
ncbi:MAG TPA: superoxide dismutase family protein [Casimicrobiaceae bacterium]